MYTFFLVVHAIVAAALVGVILMQRSEGGGLAGGGNPAGLMSARGAADFLTRTTTVLATLFVALSILLAAIAITNRAPVELDTSLAPKPAAVPQVPTSAVPMAGVPTPPAGEAPLVEDDVVTPAPSAAKPEAKVEASKPAAKPVARDAAPKAEAPKPAAEKAPSAPTSAPPAAAPAPETGNSGG